jgi:hypothetical protein
MCSTGSDGKIYQMFCIPVSQLDGWLSSINPKKVKLELQNTLLVYKKECHAILFHARRPDGGTNEELASMFASLRTEVQEGFASIRGEVDELRELIHITLPDHEEKEIRALIREVKQTTGMDGRAIIGHVRGTLGTSGVYNVPNLAQVKNVLRNLLGRGVFTSTQE